MLLLLAFAEAAAQPAPAEARTQARAEVRIERAVQASAAQWERTPKTRRREIRRNDASGKSETIRLIEHE